MSSGWCSRGEPDTSQTDADGDGLTEAQEEDLGTDPTDADSDADGYEDGVEVLDGTNPLYAYSHRYLGGYKVGTCPDPPDSEDAGPTGTGHRTISDQDVSFVVYQVGDLMENLTLQDSLGEEVTLWSFCGLTVYLEVGALECPYCMWTAPMLVEYQEALADRPFTSVAFMWGGFAEGPDEDSNDGREPITTEGLAQWSETFGLEGIPVIGPVGETWSRQPHNRLLEEGEEQGEARRFMTAGKPHAWVLGPDMRIVAGGEPWREEVDPEPYLP